MNIIKCKSCGMHIFSCENVEKITSNSLCSVEIHCGSCFEKIIKSEIEYHEQQQRFGIKYGIFK